MSKGQEYQETSNSHVISAGSHPHFSARYQAGTCKRADLEPVRVSVSRGAGLSISRGAACLCPEVDRDGISSHSVWSWSADGVLITLSGKAVFVERRCPLEHAKNRTALASILLGNVPRVRGFSVYGII